MSKRKGLKAPIISLDADEEEIEECGITEFTGYSKDAIAIFKFVEDDEAVTKPEPTLSTNKTMKFFDNRTQRSQPYGITPPVDGERFEMRRTFLFRRSTVRMLNKMKAEHENENIYLSTLVDEALRFYYESKFKSTSNRA